MQYHDNILSIIGNTPLVKINFESRAAIYAKLEYLNPGGSIKDRSALAMIEDAERQGMLRPNGTIIEASSGNQGIALAMIGAIKKYRVIITVSEKASAEKKNTILAYGAELVVCPAVERYDDPQGCWAVAKRLAHETPGSFMPDQHFNFTNVEAHYRSTGPEVWRQTGGRLTHFFAAAGTAGTISGTGKYLKKKNPKVKVFGVDAAHSYFSTKGNPKPYQIEGMGIDHDTPILNLEVIDKMIPITDKQALRMLKVMAKKFGLLMGPSSGAVAYAVRQYARKLAKDDLAVFIIADSGRAYLTKNYYSN
ncbi:MAG: cysteine synthase family protein [Patescibacteria group bacterium]